MGATEIAAPGRLHARAAGENFPVASRLIGRQLAEDLMAVYTFARLVDDIGDEADGDRTAQLADIDALLDVLGPDPSVPSTSSDEPASDQQPGVAGQLSVIFDRLGRTVRRHRLDIEPFRNLVRANQQDQHVHRYQTFADLVGYCRLSADPVGRTVLAILGKDSARAVALSDDVCTALQVIEHLQDVAEDLAAGRCYLPQQDLVRFGCTEADLLLRPSPTRVRCLLAYEASRADRLLRSGPPLVGMLSGRGRLAVGGFVAGGQATLDALARSGFVVADRAPRPSPAGTARRWAALLLGGAR